MLRSIIILRRCCRTNHRAGLPLRCCGCREAYKLRYQCQLASDYAGNAVAGFELLLRLLPLQRLFRCDQARPIATRAGAPAAAEFASWGGNSNGG